MATKKIIEVDTVNSLSDNDAIFVNSGNSLKQISKSNLVTKGADGGYYAPAVTQPDANTIRMSFTPSKEDMPAVEPVDITLPAGGGGTTTHGIVWNLVNVTSSNNAVFVADGASMVAVLTPADGYTLGDVTITMGGEVVTGAWNADTATVTIQSVTGDVVISCAGVEQTGPVDTSPIIVEYDKALDSSGGVSALVITGGCYTDFYTIPEGATNVTLYMADSESVSFSAAGKLQFWNDTKQVDYWSAASTRNQEKSYVTADGATRFRTSLATNGIEDSYAYDSATGYIYFAGKNTKYYGMTNINGSTGGESVGLLDQKDKLEHMAQCQRSIIPKDAARRISDLAEALTKE